MLFYSPKTCLYGLLALEKLLAQTGPCGLIRLGKINEVEDLFFKMPIFFCCLLTKIVV